MKRVKAHILKVSNLNHKTILELYALFEEYYDGHPFESFKHDLFQKNYIIILRNKDENQIVGFSTIQNVKINYNGRAYYGAYSGDTVVHRDYWGTKALGSAFLKHLWREKIRRPHRPFYWFLISKGYKTYLLMANNFKVHFPRFDKKTDRLHQELMNQFYKEKFKDKYIPDENLILAPKESCRLKSDIADIDQELLKMPKIKFFNDKNPDWQKGDELCCIAQMTLSMPVKYLAKKIVKNKLRQTEASS